MQMKTARIAFSLFKYEMEIHFSELCNFWCQMSSNIPYSP